MRELFTAKISTLRSRIHLSKQTNDYHDYRVDNENVSYGTITRSDNVASICVLRVPLTFRR